MNYKITYTNRKTIAIYVHKDGSVEVRCNKKTTKLQIEEFLNQKQKWIYEKKTLMANINHIKSGWKIDVGMLLLFMGKEYPLITKNGINVGFDGDSFYVPQNIDNSLIKPYIIDLYKSLAKKVITNSVIKYSQIIGVIPTNIKINSAKTRWGSCSGKNSLNFSWLLVMADENVIDYVVVHELSHIKQHNHSSKFWTEVENVVPNYKYQEEKLKQLQKKLSKEDWN